MHFSSTTGTETSNRFGTWAYSHPNNSLFTSSPEYIPANASVQLRHISTGQSKIMREEMVEARRHLAQLNPLIFAPSEKAPRGMGIGAAGVGNNRVHI